MEKITLFLAVLIFATSLTSCYEEDFINPIAAITIFPAIIVTNLLLGKVTQEIPESAAPEIYKFNDDFNVHYDEIVLKVATSFTVGGQLYLEAVQSDEGSNWIITRAEIADNKTSSKRFELDQNDPTTLAVLKLNKLTNEIDLNFNIIIQDLFEQTSIPMTVSYQGAYESN